jgi:hypothetical protein
VHHAFSGGADDRATYGADRRTYGTTRQTNDTARDGTGGHRAARCRMGLGVMDGAIDVPIEFRLVVMSVHA